MCTHTYYVHTHSLLDRGFAKSRHQSIYDVRCLNINLEVHRREHAFNLEPACMHECMSVYIQGSTLLTSSMYACKGVGLYTYWASGMCTHTHTHTHMHTYLIDARNVNAEDILPNNTHTHTHTYIHTYLIDARNVNAEDILPNKK